MVPHPWLWEVEPLFPMTFPYPAMGGSDDPVMAGYEVGPTAGYNAAAILGIDCDGYMYWDRSYDWFGGNC